MAITVLSDLIPFANQFRQGYIDAMVEASNLFNSGSNGAIIFRDSDAKGTLNKTAFFKDFGTVGRRDITANTAQDSEKIERDYHTSFRTYFKLKPIEWQDEAFWTADRMQQDAPELHSSGIIEFLLRKSFTMLRFERLSSTARIFASGAVNPLLLFSSV